MKMLCAQSSDLHVAVPIASRKTRENAIATTLNAAATAYVPNAYVHNLDASCTAYSPLAHTLQPSLHSVAAAGLQRQGGVRPPQQQFRIQIKHRQRGPRRGDGAPAASAPSPAPQVTCERLRVTALLFVIRNVEHTLTLETDPKSPRLLGRGWHVFLNATVPAPRYPAQAAGKLEGESLGAHPVHSCLEIV